MTGSNNEDIEQEVYIKTWRNIEKYKEKGKFKNWINTITVNICRDYLRSNTFKQSKNNIQEDENILQIRDIKSDTEGQLLRKERIEQVIKAIDKLKPKLREVIVMYEMKNMTYEEISKLTGCPVGTVKSRLYNARKELSTELKDLL